jgi:hypothetical protein
MSLRAGLDYGGEMHRSKNMMVMEQYDWLQNGFYTDLDYKVDEPNLVSFLNKIPIFGS